VVESYWAVFVEVEAVKYGHLVQVVHLLAKTIRGAKINEYLPSVFVVFYYLLQIIAEDRQECLLCHFSNFLGVRFSSHVKVLTLFYCVIKLEDLFESANDLDRIFNLVVLVWDEIWVVYYI
jgi:hypothetical protein